jgi:hypothetical protein
MDPDRGYRSLRSLNPRLNSVHRYAVRQKPCGMIRESGFPVLRKAFFHTYERPDLQELDG